MTTIPEDFVEIGATTDFQEHSPTIVTPNGHAIGIFYHNETFHAIDNRCPHMGFPLTKGSIENCILTCPWHHARFDITGGDTFDPWADDVQTHPVITHDGKLYINPTREQQNPDTHWNNRLHTGLKENLSLVIAKSVIGLLTNDVQPSLPLTTGAIHGTTYREAGWGAGLTTLGAMANLTSHTDEENTQRALYWGLRSVANDCAGEPPFFPQDPLRTTNHDSNRLLTWFRNTIEVRDSPGATRVLRTAIQSDSSIAELGTLLVTAATDHIYLDDGHQIDFINKAFDLLDHIGWEHADELLPSLIPGLANAHRQEESSSWNQPRDLISILTDAHAELPPAINNGSNDTWREPDTFTATLLGDDPHQISNAILTAIREGATGEQLGSAMALASAKRIAHFGVSNEFSDWNTVHHTFSYANAVHSLSHRVTGQAIYRAVLAGAMSIYLDRFLNMPPTPLPTVEASTRSDQRILDELESQFEVERPDNAEVNQAAKLVSEYLGTMGDTPELRRLLSNVLLREDIGFHPRQNIEAGFNQLDNSSDLDRKHVVYVAITRYLAAHTPTRGEGEQTFRIAQRLHRGEKIHEA